MNRQKRGAIGLAAIWIAAAIIAVAAALIAHSVARGQCVGGRCQTPMFNGWQPSYGRGISVGVQGPRGGGVAANVQIQRPQRRVDRWAVKCLVKLTSPRSVWSGILFHVEGRYGYIATTSHVFPDSEAGQTVATLHDGRRFRCGFAARDDEADAVILRIASPGNVGSAAGGVNPSAGTGIVVCGFGGGRVRYDRAHVTGIAAPGGTDRWEWFSFEPGQAAEPGDSGGPILSTGGRIVGMVSGVGTGVGVSVLKQLLGAAIGQPGDGGGGQPPDQGGNPPPPPIPDGPQIPPPPDNDPPCPCPDNGGDTGPILQPPQIPDEPIRPVVQVTQQEFNAYQIVVQNNFAMHTEAIRLNSKAINTVATEVGMTIQEDGTAVDEPSRIDELEDRVAAIEEQPAPTFNPAELTNDQIEALKERLGPAFYHVTFKDGQIVGGPLAIPYGDELRYHHKLVEGAPTDSFHVDSREHPE